MFKILKKPILVLLTIILMMSSITIVSFAAGSIISLSSKNVDVNSNVTVTVTVNGGTVMYGTSFTLKYDPSILKFNSGEFATGGNGSVKVVGMLAGATKQSYAISFTAIKPGTSVVSVSDCMYAADSEVEVTGSSTSVTVKDVTQSANADLKSLSLSKGSLSPRFSAATTSYTATVPFSVTQCKIYATAADAGATVAVSDNATLNVGNTTRTITVTAPSGAQKVYTVVITRQEEGAASSEDATSSDDATEPENPYEATVSDVSYNVLTDISGITLPKNFRASTADYNGNEVAVAVDEKSNFKIYYLKATDGDSVTPYLYNEKTKTFEKLQCLTFGENIYIVADIPTDLKASANYYSTNTEINGSKIKCYATNDNGFYNFYYVYCYFDGNYNMYSYDSVEGMFQRAPEFKLVSAEEKADVKNAGIVERFNSLATNGKVIVICLIIGIIATIALIVLLIIKLLNKNSDDSFEDGQMILNDDYNNMSHISSFSINSESDNKSDSESPESTDYMKTDNEQPDNSDDE